MKDLKNKNCFITGAANGIGRSFALALAREGMNLFITDIDICSSGYTHIGSYFKRFLRGVTDRVAGCLPN